MIWILAFRIFNSLIVRGYFSPDEYWQSLEVAHKLVFGFGELTWEWDDKSLRSIIHPGIFALLYYFLSLSNLDYPWVVAYGPRLLQGCFLAISDIFIYKVSGKSGLFLSLTSWFLFYAGVRTYSNSIELTLNSIAFYLYSKKRITEWNFIVGLACMIRPTAIIIWIPYYICELNKDTKRFLLKTTLIVVLCLGTQILIDSWYFNDLTLSFWNFLKFNLISGASSFYGTHSWYWCFVEGFPVVYLSFLPLLVLGLKRFYWTLEGMSFIIAVAVISLSPHKEYRFLLPLFPHAIWLMSRIQLKSRKLLYTLAGVQIIAVIFFSLYHQVAPLSTIDYLRNNQATSIGFFINCHGTPYYSHIHSPVTMTFLQCRPFEPQETLMFYKDPSKILWNNIQKYNYTHIVLWSSIFPKVETVLGSYKITEKIFHSYWTESFEGYESNVYFYILTKI